MHGRVQIRRRAGPGAPGRRRGDRAVHPAAGARRRAVPRCRRGPAAGLGPREAIVEGEVVAFDASAGELRPFQEVMFRRRKHGIADAVRDAPVGLFCFELLYADGEDLTRLSYPQRRARLAEAITVSPRLRLTTATEVATPAALDAAFGQAVTDGCEGLVCKSVSPAAGYQPAPAAGCGSSSSGTTAPSCRHRRPGRRRCIRRAWPPPGRLRGAAAGRLRPGRGRLPRGVQVRHRVLRRRAGHAARQAGAWFAWRAGPLGDMIAVCCP